MAQETQSQLALTLAASLPLSLSRGHGFGVLPCDLTPGKATAHSLLADDSQPLGVGQLPMVVAECLLINISEQVEGLGANVGASETALQQGPEVLHPVGVDVATDVLFSVVDDLVGVLGSQPVVAFQFIGIEGGTGLDVLPDLSLNVFLLTGLDNGSADCSSLSLQDTHDDHLSFWPTSRDPLPPFVGVHIAGLAANEALVGFDFPCQKDSGSLLHGTPDTLEHEPRALLSHLHVAGDLVGTDTVLAIGDEPNDGEPLVQSDRGILEDRSYFDGELFPALPVFTLPNTAASEKANARRTAVWTDYAVRPTTRDQVAERVVFVREELNGFHQARGRFHDSIMP